MSDTIDVILQYHPIEISSSYAYTFPGFNIGKSMVSEKINSIAKTIAKRNKKLKNKISTISIGKLLNGDTIVNIVGEDTFSFDIERRLSPRKFSLYIGIWQVALDDTNVYTFMLYGDLQIIKRYFSLSSSDYQLILNRNDRKDKSSGEIIYYAPSHARPPEYIGYIHNGELVDSVFFIANIDSITLRDKNNSMDITHLDAQPHKYSGKELDRRFGYDSYDFAARIYDPSVGRFTAPDQLAWDTPWVSPYSYCAANPVNLIDPTGEKLINNNGIEFNIKLNEARNYIGKDDFNSMLEILEKSEKIYMLKAGNFYTNTYTEIDENGQQSQRIDIFIEPSLAAVLDDNNTISPALSIYHEISHAVGFEKDGLKYVQNVGTTDSQYENEEEKRVITTIENPKAKQLGEPIRNNHKYREYIPVSDVRYHKTDGIEYYKQDKQDKQD